jgi:hypothetical protein
MAHDVFISYANQDKPIADAVCAALEARQIRCWIAPRDVLPGKAYGHAIVEALDASEILVLVFSAHANASPQVEREVERAAAKRLAILPFRLEDVPLSKHMEYFISAPHWLDAMSPPLERHLGYLGDAVQALLAQRGAAAGAAPQPPPGVRIPRPYVPAPDAAPRPGLARSGWLVGVLGVGVLVLGGLLGYRLLQPGPPAPAAEKVAQKSEPPLPKTAPPAAPEPVAGSAPQPSPAPNPSSATAPSAKEGPASPPAPARPKPSTTTAAPPAPKRPAAVAESGERVAIAPPAPAPRAPAPAPRSGPGEASPHSPNYKLPARWQDYKGFNDLVGRWRGSDRSGIVIEMEVPATEAADVTALVKIERMNCQMSLRLVRATEMFTTSQFFWKPATASPGCPEMESLYTMPVTNGMTWRYTFTDGKQVQVAMSRRI